MVSHLNVLSVFYPFAPDTQQAARCQVLDNFFTNKFEKSQKNKPYKVFSRFRTDLSLVGLNCFLYMILS